MQTANDDMDSLMRKAGVDYPLFTGSADFSKVAAAMEAAEEKPLPKQSYGKYLGLILVLLLPWLITQFDPQKVKGTASVSSKQETNQEGPIPAINSVPEANETVQAEVPAETIAPNRTITSNRTDNSAMRKSRNGNSGEPIPGLQQKNDLTRITPAQKSGQESTGIVTSKDASPTTLPGNNLSKTSSPVPGSIIGKPVTEIPAESITTVETPAEEAVSKQESTTVSNPAVPTISTQSRKKFYIGLVGGINLTTIKMQEVKDVGSDLGFIAGYKFSKGWSIEAGVLSSSKYYYSDGEYLNNPKIYLPPNTKITAVQGDCRMIEIPLVVKYDFGFKKAHNWFASAGISNFLMKQEDYAYDYYYTASGTTHTYNKTYENESKDWAAVMQISAGYMRSIPLGMNLRIEPFIQIPLKGAGYGNLPLTSAGLRLGITRSLF